MSYNGSGTFNINSTGQPVVAGTVITASAFNALTTDLATGLTTAITKDGQTTTTARITFAQGVTSSLVTDSSSVSTGSIITGGGVGIAKNLYVGVNANVAGTLGVTGVATFSAAPIYSSLTASSAVATDASKGLVSVTNTGTGNNVLATAPTIASLNLTTALTLASASGTAGQVLTSGGSGGAPTWSSPSTTSISNGTSNVTVNSSGGSITATTAGTAAVTIDTSQNVGIGTASPAVKLHVTTSAGELARFNASTAGTAHVLITNSNGTTEGLKLAYTNSDGSAFLGTIYNAYLGFITANTERMRIDDSGNLLVGTTSSGGNKMVVSGATGGTAVLGAINSTGSGNQFGISSSLGSTANNTSSAHFQGGTSGAGNWYLFGNGTTSFTSDQRLKKNIETTRDGYLADLARLRVVKYNWKNDTDGTPKELGLIAQEVEQVFAGLVQDDLNQISPDDQTIYKTLKQSVIPFMLLKAIQELKAINDTQASTITALTARVVALESK
jgi:hypothetical protein